MAHSWVEGIYSHFVTVITYYHTTPTVKLVKFSILINCQLLQHHEDAEGKKHGSLMHVEFKLNIFVLHQLSHGC